MKKGTAALIAGACGAGLCLTLVVANQPTNKEYAMLIQEGGKVHYASESIEKVQQSLQKQLGVSVDPVVSRNGQTLDGASIVATGDIVDVKVPGKGNAKYQIVIKGDVIKSGKPGMGQVTAVAEALSGDRELDGLELMAADVDNSGTVELADLVAITSYSSSFQDPNPGEGPQVEAASAQPEENAAALVEEVESINSEVLGPEAQGFLAQILERTNALRKENGLPELAMNDKLNWAAQSRAEEIAESGRFEHVRPDGSSVDTVVEFDGPSAMGENLHRNKGYGDQTAQIAMDRFTASPEHYANLVSPDYRCIGIGIAQDSTGRWIICQLFSGTDKVMWVDYPQSYYNALGNALGRDAS